MACNSLMKRSNSCSSDMLDLLAAAIVRRIAGQSFASTQPGDHLVVPPKAGRARRVEERRSFRKRRVAFEHFVGSAAPETHHFEQLMEAHGGTIGLPRRMLEIGQVGDRDLSRLSLPRRARGAIGMLLLTHVLLLGYG